MSSCHQSHSVQSGTYRLRNGALRLSRCLAALTTLFLLTTPLAFADNSLYGPTLTSYGPGDGFTTLSGGPLALASPQTQVRITWSGATLTGSGLYFSDGQVDHHCWPITNVQTASGNVTVTVAASCRSSFLVRAGQIDDLVSRSATFTVTALGTPDPTPTPTNTSVPTNTPTSTPTAIPTDTATPTATTAPTNTPTATALPATSTPTAAPATSTPIATATPTVAPTSTQMPSGSLPGCHEVAGNSPASSSPDYLPWTTAANAYSSCLANATSVALQYVANGQDAARNAQAVSVAATAVALDTLTRGTIEQNVYGASAGSASALALVFIVPVAVLVAMRRRPGG